VLLINEVMARQEFPREDAIGQTVYLGRNPAPWQIIGIVADVRQFGLDRDPEPQMFADLRQWSADARLMPLFPTGAYYVVRTEARPEAIVPALRNLVGELDADATLFNVAPMDALVATTIARPRMYAVLLGVFAAIGATLALIGIYGVITYGVTQRTREIGIRMALGAQRAEVLGLVLRQAMFLAAAGVLAGLAGSRAVAHYLDGMLFGLTPLDPGTFAAVTVSFVLIVALAALAPARRATRIDPVVALRHE
jgi:putative ABC transport system permease protein